LIGASWLIHPADFKSGSEELKLHCLFTNVRAVICQIPQSP